MGWVPGRFGKRQDKHVDWIRTYVPFVNPGADEDCWESCKAVDSSSSFRGRLDQYQTMGVMTEIGMIRVANHGSGESCNTVGRSWEEPVGESGRSWEEVGGDG